MQKEVLQLPQSLPLTVSITWELLTFSAPRSPLTLNFEMRQNEFNKIHKNLTQILDHHTRGSLKLNAALNE